MAAQESWTESNAGIIPADHQRILHDACILLAGTGAEGSATAVCLARLGVGRFRLADIDRFETKNINRQFACYRDTVGEYKVDALAAEIKRINPDAHIEVFHEGVTAENAAALVDGAACIAEGIDMYEAEAAIALDQSARAAGVHMVAGLSLGFRSDIYVFSPTGVGLVEFCLDAVSRREYPFILCDPAPSGFPDELARTMTGLFEGLPDPNESLAEFLPAFRAKVAATPDLAIPAIAPTVFLTGARVATEIYGIVTGARTPVLAPGFTSVDLMEVGATVTDLAAQG